MIDFSDMDFTRSYCKKSVENLEIWIRNLIDNVLTDQVGPGYIDFTKANGDRLIKNEFVKGAIKRKAEEPERYPRLIDAMLLDNVVDIICNSNLHNTYFREALMQAYPCGNEEARAFLKQLIDIRNKLYHSNPISIREAEKIVCYSNDVIDSIKQYYKNKSMDRIYNAPTIIKVADSFGNQFNSSQIVRNTTGRGVCQMQHTVYTGDTINIEVEIDTSFQEDEYTIQWVFDKKEESSFHEESKKISISIENKHVKTDFAIFCLIISKKDWHRCGDVDDSVVMIYEIAPRR